MMDASPPNYPHPEAEFRAALAEGRFLIQRCAASGNYLFYPRVISPWSGQPTLHWVEPSGRGKVHSTTTVRRKPDQGGDYNVALIDLDEGPRMMSRVVDIDPPAVKIGMAVEAQIRSLDGTPAVVFVPLSDKA